MQTEIITQPMTREAFLKHADIFDDMVKVVVDIAGGAMAVGGEMHVDGEQVLLQNGSKQESLWGANVYVGRSPEDRIEYISMINIRPRQGNRGQEVVDAALRERIRTIIDTLIPV